MTPRCVLLTGANGFVGSYLCRFLEDHFVNVIPMPENCDIRDVHALGNLCSSIRPDAVIHLAAQSFVPRSFDDPRETYDINFLGTLNLLEALKSNDFKGSFLYVGSSDVYGVVKESQLPIVETVPFSPRSPYAVSKAATELLCSQWAKTEVSWRIITVRPFNHIGPGHDERFVISRLCMQVARIKKGLQSPVIEVGNLDVTRDFTDVQDVVRAYWLLLQYGKNGAAYNVCSGCEVLLSDILPLVREISGVDFEVNILPELCRPTEQRRVKGDFNKIHMLVGWKPEISLQQSLADIYAYWLARINLEK